MDNLTAGEEKCLFLIQQIQEMHKQGLGIAEITKRTGKAIGTVKKYREGEPIILCRGRRGKSKLDPFRDVIIEELKAKIHHKRNCFICKRILKQLKTQFQVTKVMVL